MKKYLLLFLSVAYANITKAQKTYELKDLFTEKSVVWYGIDYSKTSFVGPFGDKDLNTYFVGWNSLIMEEPSRYNVARSMYKLSVTKDLTAVEKINASTQAILSDNDSLLTSSEIAQMVAKYEGIEKEGLGLALLAESYNRKKNVGSHYAVVFDIATKKVLIKQKFTANTGGLGVRNYWAFTIYETLNMLSDSYRRWRKKYGDNDRG